MSDPFAQLDASYALGALDADDLAAYEAHLRICASCRERVEELRSTVRRLAAARAGGYAGDAPDGGPVPDTLLPGLLRRAERERSRRRWATRSIAGLAAACLVTLAVMLWPSSSPARPAAQALVAVRTTPVQATARLVAKPWGTEIDIRCTHDRDAPAGSAEPAVYGGDYRLVVVDRDSRKHDLGGWAPKGDRTIYFTSGTAVRRERIARVQIVLPDGKPILQLTM